MNINMPMKTNTGLQAEDEEINLMELILVVAKYNRFILKLMAGTALSALVFSLLMPNIYTSKTVFMPPPSDTSLAGMLMGQMTGLGGGGASGGLSAALGLKNPNDIYVGMLQSDTIADHLISRFKLKALYKTDSQVLARKTLESHVKISAGKDGLIAVEFDDRDAKFAAVMANAYVEELSLLSQNLALTDAAQRNLFFEKQLEGAKAGLLNAEDMLRQTQEKTGLLQLDGQGKGIIEAVANLRAQIAAKEVEIASMRAFSTEQNPDYRQARAVLSSLNAQLNKVERAGASGQDGLMIPAGKLPAVGLEYVRKLREVKYYEKLYELMSQQVAIAKIDMAKDPTLIQVVDKATESDRKSKPKRSVIVLMVTVLAFFIGVLWAFFKEASERAKQNPEQVERMNLLRRYLKQGQ